MLYHMEICEEEKETMPLYFFSQVDVLAEITYPLAVSAVFYFLEPSHYFGLDVMLICVSRRH